QTRPPRRALVIKWPQVAARAGRVGQGRCSGSVATIYSRRYVRRGGRVAIVYLEGGVRTGWSRRGRGFGPRWAWGRPGHDPAGLTVGRTRIEALLWRGAPGRGLDQGALTVTSLKQQLQAYGAYHRDPRNKLTHFLGVPLVTFALFLALG